MKIAWKFQLKINLRFTLKLLEMIQKQTFIKKNKNPRLNSESLSELENSETEVSLEQFI